MDHFLIGFAAELVKLGGEPVKRMASYSVKPRESGREPKITFGKATITKRRPKKAKPNLTFGEGTITKMPEKKDPTMTVGEPFDVRRTVDKIPADAQRAPKGSMTADEYRQKVNKWNRLKAFASKDLKPGAGLQMPPYPGSYEAERLKRKATPTPAPRVAGTKK